MSPADHTIKSRVAAISVLASTTMATAKFVVGIAIGSLALVSEALHSSVDVVATVVTWLVVRVSDRPADEEHHYGHGKLESVSALGVIAMLYVLAGGILVESYSRLSEGAPPPTVSAIPFIVLLIDIAVNFWRARALQRTARDTKSQALAADALHFASDVLGSVAVIIGLALAGLGYAWGDAVAAIGVAVMIALLGLRMARSTVETLLDRAPEGASARAAAAIRAVPGVVDVERLRVRMVGSTHFIEAIVQVPRTYPIDRVEEIKQKAQEAVAKALGEADLTFTAVPVARNNESVRERIMVIARNSGLAASTSRLTARWRLTPPTTSPMSWSGTSARSSARTSRSTPTSSRLNRNCRTALTPRPSALKPSRARYHASPPIARSTTSIACGYAIPRPAKS
jgi:cation diffusion facilitator family transporter